LRKLIGKFVSCIQQFRVECAYPRKTRGANTFLIKKILVQTKQKRSNMSDQERYPCSLCWQESGGKLIVPNVQGFNLGSGGHWYACEKHLNNPMFQKEEK